MSWIGFLGPLSVAAGVAGLLLALFSRLFRIEEKLDRLKEVIDAVYRDVQNTEHNGNSGNGGH